MLLLVVRVTVTHFSGVFLSSIFINYSVSKIVQVKSYQIPVDICSISPVLKKLHWLLVEHRSVFKTTILVYKFLHTGFPKYYDSYISSYSSSYSTRHSQSGGNFLVVPKVQPPIHKSIKQFGYSFAFDAPTRVSPEPLSESSLKPTCTPRYTLCCAFE